ncbi:MAG: DEAD/DEAH box helicase family protein, partial [Bacteroidales bacterium]|nr:DEAD/DEAH box helicase family protein [Bacteroidales bacterium]
HIRLNNKISLNRTGLNKLLIEFLREKLNIHNTEYFIKQKSGKSTHNTERFFNFIDESEHEVSIPRGMAGQLLAFCKQNNISYEFHDERNKLEDISFNNDFQLREHQLSAISASNKKDFGIIVSPPGTGKTIIGLKIIAKKQQPALIVVHRKQLAEQWIERIQSFLKIPQKEIGIIGQGKSTIGKKITIAMIQTEIVLYLRILKKNWALEIKL